MYVILFLVALFLAWPTFGLSLAIYFLFFFFKKSSFLNEWEKKRLKQQMLKWRSALSMM